MSRPKQQPVQHNDTPKAPEVEMHQEELGILISRSRDGCLWRCTFLTRNADGKVESKTEGLIPRRRFHQEYVRALQRLKDFIFDRGSIV